MVKESSSSFGNGTQKKKFAIYSANEAAMKVNEGGFWSAENKQWTSEENATMFSIDEITDYTKNAFPLCTGNDAKWVECAKMERIIVVMNDGILDHSISENECELLILDYEAAGWCSNKAKIPQVYADGRPRENVDAAFELTITDKGEPERIEEIFEVVQSALEGE